MGDEVRRHRGLSRRATGASMGLSKSLFSVARRAIGTRRLAHLAARACRSEIDAELSHRFGDVVRRGPFAGMKLVDRRAWGDGDRAGVLLGLYEANLHEPILDAVAKRPELVINIGCADGTYAVGLARLLPDAEIHAFDIDPRAGEVCMAAARLNGVEGRLHFSEHCTSTTLRTLLAGKRGLIVSDCEGAEADIIDLSAIPALSATNMIVECHRSGEFDTATVLMDRLRMTHDVIAFGEGPRDPHGLEELEGMSEFERWLIAHEGRPDNMTWIYARAREREPRP